MSEKELPADFLIFLQSITAKRPRVVIDHILAHGYITTEELKDYGYNHPPRAARDVREQGVPLETFRVKGSDGRTIAAYRFGDPLQMRQDRAGGRRVFSKAFKRELIDRYGTQCAICSDRLEARYLQIDHRIPYEVAGEVRSSERQIEDYMLLCGTCNRAKSWSCEHCINLMEKRLDICHACYWANPNRYSHVALRLVRRLDITWTEGEVATYEQLQSKAEIVHEPLPEFVKSILSAHLSKNQ